MAYDDSLAQRVRTLLPASTEQPMFGGLGFLTRGGHMAVCVSGTGEGLLVRVPAEESEALASQDGVVPMRMGGRDSRTWLLVAPERLHRDDLGTWVRRGVAVAESLPPKPPR